MATKNSDVTSKKSNSGVVTKPTMAKTHAARTEGLFLAMSHYHTAPEQRIESGHGLEYQSLVTFTMLLSAPHETKDEK
jgi:hypothetical protein